MKIENFNFLFNTAMGFPASGLEVQLWCGSILICDHYWWIIQGTWRNSINEVAMMLKKYHSGKYMVLKEMKEKYSHTHLWKDLEFEW